MAKKQANKEGLTVKKAEFSEWYTQVILKAGLVDYSPVSGCLVFRPSSYEIWEKVQDFFNKEIKKLGVKNAYFPLFIPEKLLTKEKEHVEGFSPEVAWVTYAGDSKLNEKLAIRPTSETIMYDSYSKWIRSYKDLPLKLNQWCSVVRWEFNNPVPFLRTREFLWQEGHTVFADKKEAEKEVMDILMLYKRIFEEMFAVPVLAGRKSEKEKFAGANYTTSVEALMPNGKAIQGATSHHLGQNFSKAFNIKFLNENEKYEYGYQNSWGISTRSIGVMLAMHGDDRGLVIPPKIAENKVAIVPIMFKEGKEKVLKKSKEINSKLKKFNPILDDREDYSPGWKFNELELKGIPLRIEIGPKELSKNEVVLVRRDTMTKKHVKITSLSKEVDKTLNEIQENLFNKAKKFLDSSIVKVSNVVELSKAVDSGKLGKGSFCGSIKCEEEIKNKTGAKSLNFEFKESKGTCLVCKQESKNLGYFGKSY